MKHSMFFRIIIVHIYDKAINRCSKNFLEVLKINIFLIALILYFQPAAAQGNYMIKWKNKKLICGFDSYFELYDESHIINQIDSIACFYSQELSYDDEEYEINSKFQLIECQKIKDNLFFIKGGSELFLNKGLGVIMISLYDTEHELISSIYDYCESIPVEVYFNKYRYQGYQIDTISYSIFEKSLGLIAPVTCCGFDARCRVVSYDLYIANLKTEFKIDSSHTYQDHVQYLEYDDLSGSMIVFKNIFTKCPGEKSTNQAKNLIFFVE